jgi:hypothetical protein
VSDLVGGPVDGHYLDHDVCSGKLASMWTGHRRRQAATVNAIVGIVHNSVLYMRAMAHTRESMCDDIFPGTDYSEQIRELANVCDNLVPGLRHGGSRRTVDALQYTWDNLSEAQQQWIRRCLTVRGVVIEDLIETAADRQRVMPN